MLSLVNGRGLNRYILLNKAGLKYSLHFPIYKLQEHVILAGTLFLKLM